MIRKTNPGKKILMNKIKIYNNPPIKGFTIIKTLSGTYVCPGWHLVPHGTTRDHIDFIVSDTTSLQKMSDRDLETLEFNQLSSKGDRTYTITRKTGIWHCDCPANSFKRKDCKHIQHFKNITVKDQLNS